MHTCMCLCVRIYMFVGGGRQPWGLLSSSIRRIVFFFFFGGVQRGQSAALNQRTWPIVVVGWDIIFTHFILFYFELGKGIFAHQKRKETLKKMSEFPELLVAVFMN